MLLLEVIILFLKLPMEKKVSSVKISAYPLYQNYVYSVDKVTSNRGLTFRTKNVGTGTARKAVGYSFKRTFYY